MEEERPEYYYRLVCLFVDLGTEVLRKVFKMYIPNGHTIETFLKSKSASDVVNSLNRRRVLNDMRLNLIRRADEAQFDISLLYDLFRYLTHIQAPITGWDRTYPLPNDRSPGAFLNTLKSLQNEVVVLRPKAALKRSEFERFWKDAEEALVNLAGEVSQPEKAAIQQRIGEAKSKPLLGTEYYYRLLCLFVDLGTEVLLKVFKKYIPTGHTIETFLRNKSADINSLKTKMVLNDMHLNLIRRADEAQFDISLLYVLIRSFTHIQEPSNGWKSACPLPGDRSPGAFLNKLKALQKEIVALRPKVALKSAEFERFWKETEEALVELAGEVSHAEKAAIQQKIEEAKLKCPCSYVSLKCLASRVIMKKDIPFRTVLPQSLFIFVEGHGAMCDHVIIH